MRESWTDDRMDDLDGKVGRIDADVRALRVEMKNQFASVQGEMKDKFAAVRSEIREGFDKIDKRFDKVDRRFERVDERFEKVDEGFEQAEIRRDERFEAMMDRLYSMQRLMLQFCGGAMVALVGFFATQV